MCSESSCFNRAASAGVVCFEAVCVRQDTDLHREPPINTAAQSLLRPTQQSPRSHKRQSPCVSKPGRQTTPQTGNVLELSLSEQPIVSLRSRSDITPLSWGRGDNAAPKKRRGLTLPEARVVRAPEVPPDPGVFFDDAVCHPCGSVRKRGQHLISTHCRNPHKLSPE